MTKKTDPLQLSVFDPVGFRRAHDQAQEAARGAQLLLRSEINLDETVQVIYGPLPLPGGTVDLCFQVIWFGSSDCFWPEEHDTPTPVIRTETENLGRMVLWTFATHQEASDLCDALWGLEVPEMTVQ